MESIPLSITGSAVRLSIAFVGSYEGFRDIFCPDGLHLRPEIYREFAAYFVKKLEALSI